MCVWRFSTEIHSMKNGFIYSQFTCTQAHTGKTSGLGNPTIFLLVNFVSLHSRSFVFVWLVGFFFHVHCKPSVQSKFTGSFAERERCTDENTTNIYTGHAVEEEEENISTKQCRRNNNSECTHTRSYLQTGSVVYFDSILYKIHTHTHIFVWNKVEERIHRVP